MSSLTLPAAILEWMEKAVGHPVLSATRIPGGGTRQGWFIDVDASSNGNGNTDGIGDTGGKLFLRYSPQPLPARSAFHRLATEAEVIRALGGAGIAVPAVYAVHPVEEAVLLERVPGDTWFYRLRDPDEQVRVAQDFIRSLAKVHRLDPARLDIPGLGPVRSAREHALERIAQIRRRATAPDGSIDPLVRLSADWLEAHVPDYDGPVVLVQGDTGPGNFLYQDGRVTAVLDWELCHFGDPMDDIAWLSLRTVQDTFTHLPDRLAEYEKLSGHAIDVDRIRYYRVFAETTMATLTPHEGPGVPAVDGEQRAAEQSAAEKPAAEQDVGNLMLYLQLHRRLWLEALNAVMGLELTKPVMPEPAEPRDWQPLYADVLAMLRTITPRITDPLASQWLKGIARMVRHLRELDACGRERDELEQSDIALLLGYHPSSLQAGRDALARANAVRRVSDEDFTRYLWNRVMRDDHVMRHASGALHFRTWPPLTDVS
ncbi:phosphotransferase family protein [Frankia sp. ACN1ag]|uniref:phosphotransferase family protein n=1 Tax=Frankia sp. ACN1ag TaxID=102891 RepID=UPI0006DC8CDC|nr:phosphotransferase family protein [Frankia sp. ACN1ag]KQC36697.1 aminoglycoside phosphotransferase [Frankia sp. ACN1ag]